MTDPRSAAFQRAFVAVSYMAGRRGDALLEALVTPHEEARSLVQRLAHPERERRAEALARELARLVVALETRSLR